MNHQTIIWTALPKELDGQFQEGSTAKLSAFISPRLWSTTPEVSEKLSAFPDFLLWPDKVKTATFQVDFGDGVLRPATADFSSLRPELWQALFNDQTAVIPFVFEDYSCTEIENGPVAGVEDLLKNVYQEVAIEQKYGRGTELPKAVDLKQQPVLDAIGRPYVPEEPPERQTVPDRPPAETPWRPDEEEPGAPGGPGDTGKNDGCVYGCLSGCLTIPLQLLKLLAKLLGMVLMAPFMAVTQVQPGDAKNSTEQLNAALKPYQKVPEDSPKALPTDQEIKNEYDFHGMVAAAGDYPWLLKALGLVVELEVALEAPLPAAAATVKIIPTLTLSLANSTQVSLRTHYELADNHFLAQSRPGTGEIVDGFLQVDDKSKYRVVQVDAVGGGVKLANFASNLKVLGDEQLRTENSPEEAGLPALRTAGLALVKPQIAKSIKKDLQLSAALNAHVAAIDNSPVVPCPSGGPPLPPTDTLFAEDLVRGYCIDIFDNHSQSWHSLCQRDGKYDFGNGLEEPSVVDEGFVVLGGTEAPKKRLGSAPEKLRMFESLITWSGWSLSAPRPGRTILSDLVEPPAGQEDAPAAYEMDYPENPAATNFPLSATFKTVKGTLPRLRFGWKYRMRVRVVDLAGNRVVSPAEGAAFQADVPHKTEEVTYGRFEPVDPPPVILKDEPTLGESLERLVVRSNHDDKDDVIKNATSERHIAPPKTSQLMAEQLGRFDAGQKMNSSAYDLAAREAGTLMEQFNKATGKLEPIPGTKVTRQTDPADSEVVLHTHYLQTADDFVVKYLPDPLARGVLLLGLPGMNPFDQVIEPSSGQIINKIPFDGSWPDNAPLRIRLIGAKSGQTPGQPVWNGSKRFLTVEVPQGETYHVRISSYFEAADLTLMGVWQWIEETEDPAILAIQQAAEQGRNWMHLPWRTLVLVHAVKQPLKIPGLSDMTADKNLGETGVQLAAKIQMDAKSTGKVDLRAAWSDPLDDPSKGLFNPVTDKIDVETHVTELLVPESTGDTWQVPKELPPKEASRLWQDFGDTKFHAVTYQALGTTSFREYFDPPQTPAEIQDMMRPTPEELQDGTADAFKTQQPVLILNSARPAAPKVLYVLPTFQWSRNTSGTTINHNRISGGLRVYMERPWYSSGAGELLGVLLRPEGLPADPDLPLDTEKYISQWGMDPVWDSFPTEPLLKQHFIEFVDENDNLSLDEVARDKKDMQKGVDVIGFEVHYDASRDLWFAEVVFDPAAVRSYFPFVRLALARFQPNSAYSKDADPKKDGKDSAHLSRVVRADFVQLPPERSVLYDTSDLANQKVKVRVSGPGNIKDEQFNIVTVSVEERDPLVVDDSDPLGWRPVGNPTPLKPATQTLDEVVWKGDVDLSSAASKPVRLVVREWEVLLADAEATVRLPEEIEEPQTPGMMVPQSKRARTVFADELILP